MTIRDPRMLFGFAVLLIIAFLSARIALGHVEQSSSYGLDILLGSLATLSGSFAQWAFSGAKVPPSADINNKEGRD